MSANTEEILDIIKLFASEPYDGLKGEFTPDNIYSYLYQKVVRSREQLYKNNMLLNGWLYPKLRNSTALTREEADDLFGLAQALFQPASSLDIGLAALIYEALIEYARASHDDDFLIKSLYWNALSLYYMDNVLFRDEVLKLFSEAAAFRSRYKEFNSFETRKYINRSLGNIFVATAAVKEVIGSRPILKIMDEARAFWEDEEIRAFDPEMPWDLFIYSIHQNTCTMLSILREAETDNRDLAGRVRQSALFLNRHAEANYGRTQAAHVRSRLRYFDICSAYHAGELTAKEAGGMLLEIMNSADDKDYSLDTVNKLTHTGLAAFYYLQLDPDYPEEDLKRLRSEHIWKVVSYCANIPRGATQFTADAMIGAFAKSISEGIDSGHFIDIILKLTTYRHLPTYAHALMVSWLAELLCAYLCDHEPSYFIGVEGTNTAEEVVQKRDDIIRCARISGLCHDAGKIIYVNTIATYGRKLSNREFDMVRRHPDKGYELLVKSGSQGIADVARGHHKWYDGSKGFPADYDHRQSSYRPIIDLISVCDRIDNETDILARAQVAGLSYREISRQIQAMSGTKYAPEVAAALKDADTAESIDRLLTVNRREAYVIAYRHMFSGGNL